MLSIEAALCKEEGGSSEVEIEESQINTSFNLNMASSQVVRVLDNFSLYNKSTGELVPLEAFEDGLVNSQVCCFGDLVSTMEEEVPLSVPKHPRQWNESARAAEASMEAYKYETGVHKEWKVRIREVSVRLPIPLVYPWKIHVRTLERRGTITTFINSIANCNHSQN